MSGRPDGGLQQYFGLYPAKVSDSKPDNLGRIEVELPWLGQNPADEAGQEEDGNEPVKIRATLLSVWAAANQGFLAIPPTGSQVIVGFEAGNLARAYVVGACWNGVEQMPHQGKAEGKYESTKGDEKRQVLRTGGGHYIELDETSGTGSVKVASSNGHTITLDGKVISITHASGHTVTLEASGAITIKANATVDITAPAGMNVTAPMAKFSGMVQCTTLIATTSVVSPSYTPGFGNLL